MAISALRQAAPALAAAAALPLIAAWTPLPEAFLKASADPRCDDARNPSMGAALTAHLQCEDAALTRGRGSARPPGQAAAMASRACLTQEAKVVATLSACAATPESEAHDLALGYRISNFAYLIDDQLRQAPPPAPTAGGPPMSEARRAYFGCMALMSWRLAPDARDAEALATDAAPACESEAMVLQAEAKRRLGAGAEADIAADRRAGAALARAALDAHRRPHPVEADPPPLSQDLDGLR